MFNQVVVSGGMVLVMLLTLGVVSAEVYSLLKAGEYAGKEKVGLVQQALIALERYAWGSPLLYEFYMENCGLVPAYRVSTSVFIMVGMFATLVGASMGLHVEIDAGLALTGSFASGLGFLVVRHGKAFLAVREDIAAQQAAGTWALA